ncbi:low temperature requirement protein A [Streptomyces sp. B93]|uniref:low temperature requirement protein A n=1 Tax=Streptomyces sp. B93 TaxID=2824875 RepID=UPI001FFD2431|nr:low temperature requirement protein A [Streptomyces sp. B93]
MAYLAGCAAMIVTSPPARVAATLTITDALTERFGLLVIIMLGETVKGVVDGLAGAPGALSITTGLVAVVVGFGAWWTYFDFAGHRRPRATPLATVQWILTHLPLAGAMTAMAAAMPTLVEYAHDSRTPAAAAWVLCGSVAVVLCATMVLVVGLQAWDETPGLYRPLARTSVVVAVIVVVLGTIIPLRCCSPSRSCFSSASPGASPWRTASPERNRTASHGRNRSGSGMPRPADRPAGRIAGRAREAGRGSVRSAISRHSAHSHPPSAFLDTSAESERMEAM